MDSFTKDIIKTHNGRWRPKLKKSEYYIYRLPIEDSAKFYRAAGGVGSKIYEYLKWKKEMNGNKLITLPNDYFDKTWGIARQRICEALDKLKSAGLVELEKSIGKSTLVKLHDKQI
jgi:hypothetical protein|tara:strand:- start:65 stop:412 length:348 start_codon:yes stop_codon:yes gene_type:complete